jgi:hypothetical protein
MAPYFADFIFAALHYKSPSAGAKFVAVSLTIPILRAPSMARLSPEVDP